MNKQVNLVTLCFCLVIVWLFISLIWYTDPLHQSSLPLLPYVSSNVDKINEFSLNDKLPLSEKTIVITKKATKALIMVVVEYHSSRK